MGSTDCPSPTYGLISLDSMSLRFLYARMLISTILEYHKHSMFRFSRFGEGWKSDVFSCASLYPPLIGLHYTLFRVFLLPLNLGHYVDLNTLVRLVVDGI